MAEVMAVLASSEIRPTKPGFAFLVIVGPRELSSPPGFALTGDARRLRKMAVASFGSASLARNLFR